jgi:hypothetical protein
VSELRWKETAQTRAVMTIREKFADQKFLMSKYKDELMVLFLLEGFKGISVAIGR